MRECSLRCKIVIFNHAAIEAIISRTVALALSALLFMDLFISLALVSLTSKQTYKGAIYF